MRIIHSIMFSVVALTTLSCGTKPSHADLATDESFLRTQVESPISPAILTGAWDSSCRLSQINTPFYERTSNIFTGGRGFTQERRIFIDSKCETSAAIATASGTYELTSFTTPNVKSITYRISYAQLETVSSAGVAAFNSVKGCGYSDWRINLARNITGKACWGYTISKHDLWKDLVSLQNQKLFFGKRIIDSQGRYNSGDRPSELHSTDPFVRR